MVWLVFLIIVDSKVYILDLWLRNMYRFVRFVISKLKYFGKIVLYKVCKIERFWDFLIGMKRVMYCVCMVFFVIIII